MFLRFKRFLRNSKLWKFFNRIHLWHKKISQLRYILFVYFLIIFVFSLLLWSPITQNNPEQNWYSFKNYINAIFTTASAFSDTGLIVYDTYIYWNMFGQAIISILIVLGGIGIFAIKFFIINYLFRKSVSTLTSVQVLQSERGDNDINSTIKLVTSSVKFLLFVILFSGFFMSLYFYFASPSQTFGISKYLNNQYINPQGNLSLAFRFGYFHTISAINNAGFDIISNRSIMPYYLNYGLQIWIIVLLVIGGIGYPTIYDFHKFLKRKLRGNKKKYHFSLFSKVSIITYILVLLVGMIITISLETTSHSNSTLWNRIYIPQHLSNTYIKWVEAYNNSPDLLNLLTVSTKENLPLEQKEWFDVLNQGSIPGEISSLKDYINQGTMYGSKFDRTFAIIFTAFSTRSAGFATVNVRHFTHSSTLIWIIMMLIGAAPSSTGGGIRTTTLALLVMSGVSVLLGRKRVRLFKRAIEPKTVFMSGQAFAFAFVIVIFISFISFSSFDIHGGNIQTSYITQKAFDSSKPFYDTEHLIFEVASAFGTTGLSTGITQDLNIISKLGIILTMFIGQFGVSSTLLVWKRKRAKDRNYEYITEDIAIG